MSLKAFPLTSSSRSNSPMKVFRMRRVLPAISLLALSACGGTPDDFGDDSEVLAGSATQALKGGNGHGNGHGHGHRPNGKELFQTAFDDTNDRSCATCHVLEDHTGLTPAHVQAAFAANPNDPLFNPIDADDPNAAEPTYEHLKKGLVRVVIHLPDNMDLIDFAGNVVTGPDRNVEVWRAVPSVANAAITAPYQYDGRKGNLQEQAQAAISSHSQGPIVDDEDLDAIAEFQQELFTSNRAKWVAKKMDKGIPAEEIPRPELRMDDLTPAQARGLEVYNTACEGCHGGSTTLQITNREVHALAFVELKPDGTVLFDTSVTPPQAVLRPQPNNNEFVNIGFANLSYLGQLFGDFFGPRFNASVSLPQYRYRFYTDGTRSQQAVDLPPIPPGGPFNFGAVDENGAPIFGPNFLPQMWSTDPGRAAITGDPVDFEAFDMPPLRGVAHTAPYFHDNLVETLRDAVDIYSRFVLPFFGPALNLPANLPPEPGSFFPESLSPQQKDDLLEFLAIL